MLGSYPDAPGSLRASIEVDVQAKNRPERTDLIDGALGELSMFHQTHGFYVHGVSIESAVLPTGWKNRTIPVHNEVRTRGNTGHCLEAHDLAASKLVAGREKDWTFVTTLLVEQLIDADVLLERIKALPIDADRAAALSRWVDAVAAELGLRP